jgi:uncharacterized protein (TIGR02246 family)
MAIQNPQDTHRLFAEAANSGDIERLVSFYEPEAVIVERNGELSVGTAAIRSHIQHLLALHPVMQIQTSRTFGTADLALLCSRWTATVTTPDGTEAKMDCRGSEILRRQPDGSWCLVVDNPWGIDLTD